MEDELAEILEDSTHHEFDPEMTYIEKDRRRIRDIHRARRRPQLEKSPAPPVIAALQDLVAQIEAYRKEIPDLDDRLMERRRAFEFTDELNEAQTSAVAPTPRPQSSPMDPFNLLHITRPSSARDPPRSGYNTPGERGRQQPPSLFLPSRGASPVMQEPSSPFEEHISETSQRRIKVKVPGQMRLHLPPPPESTDGNTKEGSIASSGAEDVWPEYHLPHANAAAKLGGHSGHGEFTLSHLLTNIMILQVCFPRELWVRLDANYCRNSYWNWRR